MFWVCFFTWVFVSGLLVHIRQMEKIALEIAAKVASVHGPPHKILFWYQYLLEIDSLEISCGCIDLFVFHFKIHYKKASALWFLFVRVFKIIHPSDEKLHPLPSGNSVIPGFKPNMYIVWSEKHSMYHSIREANIITPQAFSTTPKQLQVVNFVTSQQACW